MRPSEGIVFFALAAGIHASIWHLAPQSSGAAASGGAGADTLTLAAASPAQMAMIARWQKPPEASSATPEVFSEGSPAQAHELPVRPALPTTARPALPTAPALPQLTAMPKENPLPQIDVTPAAPPKAADLPPKVRPKTRPPAPKVQAAAPALSQPERRAAGQARQAQLGTSGKDLTQSANANRSNALRAKWGAQIHAKVQRNMRYPRGAGGSGTAKLNLKVAPNGKLQALSVLRSSGNAMLDKAAIHAVQRAGRFAKAPKGLQDPVYAFSLSLTFSR